MRQGLADALPLTTVWVATAIFNSLAPPTTLGNGMLSLAVVVTLAVIIYAAFGVLRQADLVSGYLGEPFASLVLTLTVVLTEIALISAVMLGPVPAPTIGRDSIFSVMMIIMNLVLGVSILLGSRKHGSQVFSPRATRLYLLLIALLSIVTFIGPRLFPAEEGGFPLATSWIIIGVSIFGYAGFLFFQSGPGREWFQDKGEAHTPRLPVDAALVKSALILVFLLIGIALMAENLAAEFAVILERTGWPEALSGLIIAIIVFTPEALTSFSAATSNQMQRVINLCQGGYLSTIALSVPAVLALGIITNQEVIWQVSAVNSWFLVVTLLLAAFTFGGKRTHRQAGFLHLFLFIAFVPTIFF